MMDVTFELERDGERMSPDELDDNYELAMLFEHTQEQVRRQVERQLGHLRCPQHRQPPRVVVTLDYSEETGQADLRYHLDTCCQPFLLEAVRRLNH